MKPIEKKVYEIVLPFTDELGLEIYDVIYEKQGKDMYLSIYIDKDGGVSVDDCEALTNAINDVLDEKLDIKDQYMLEVSSPGLERRIREDDQLKMFLNKQVSISLFKAVDKKKEFIGTLKKFTSGDITINVEDSEYTFKRDEISLIKSVYDWDNIEGGNEKNEG